MAAPCVCREGEEAERRRIPSHGRAPPPPGPFPSRPAPPAMLRRRRERERRDRGALGACGAHGAGRARPPRSGCSLPQVTPRGRSAEGRLCSSARLSCPAGRLGREAGARPRGPGQVLGLLRAAGPRPGVQGRFGTRPLHKAPHGTRPPLSRDPVSLARSVHLI